MTWLTHAVTNQALPMQAYNLFTADPALREGAGPSEATGVMAEHGAQR